MHHRTRRAAPRELSRSEIGTAKHLRLRPVDGDGHRNERELAQLRMRCAALEGANAAKDQALSMIAHDLRSPLGAILGWTELVQNDIPGTADRALATIARNARAAIALVEDLLHAGRNAPLEVVPCDLRSLAAATVDGALPAAKKAHITLRLVDGADDAKVLADPRGVTRILQNLVGNALKFTPPDGHVDVEIRPLAGVVELEVRDDGRGIDSALLPHVFERGTQDDEARAKGLGLGLGLFIVQRLVALQGGAVRVSSGAAGTAFTVALPQSL